MNREDIDKLIGGGAGLSPEHQAALAIYRALICVADTDPVQFWNLMLPEHHAEALGILDAVGEKLVALSVEERLRVIGKAASGRRS